MSSVTEIAFAPAKKGIRLTDPSSDAYKTLTEQALRLIKGWKGCPRIYFGVEIEDPDKLRLFVDWDSVKVHDEANKDPAYLPAVVPIGSLCSGPHTVFHARFQPHPPAGVLVEPVTEVITTYFPAGYSVEDQKKYHDSTVKLFKACQALDDGCLSSTSGWVDKVQEVEGEKFKTYVALLGWKSVDHHLNFRKTVPFRRLIEGMKDQSRDWKKMESVHVKVTEYKG